MKRFRIGASLLAATLLLTSCSSPSKALEPLSQICSGMKYIWDRAVDLNDGTQVSALIEPVMASAKNLDPESPELRKMRYEQREYWAWIKASNLVNRRAAANISANRAGRIEPYDFGELASKREQLGMTEPRDSIKNLCSKIEKEVKDSGLDVAKNRVLQAGLDSYINTQLIVESKPDPLVAAALKARTDYFAKNGFDEAGLHDYCSSKAEKSDNSGLFYYHCAMGG